MSEITEIFSENDNKYVSISFTARASDTNALITLDYNVTKTQPIIERANEYYVTVIKFDIPLKSLPLAIMPIIPNQGNPNLSTLVVGIRSAGVNYLRNVIYVPTINLPPPVQNAPNQVITPYYYIYTYQNMISMINTALAGAFADSGLAGTAPYYIYDSTTELISLIVSSSFN